MVRAQTNTWDMLTLIKARAGLLARRGSLLFGVRPGDVRPGHACAEEHEASLFYRAPDVAVGSPPCSWAYAVVSVRSAS